MVTTDECQIVIDAILDFKEKVYPVDKRASKELMFLLGEYYVLQKLCPTYPNAEHKGGQVHCDIIIENPHIEIEVKTSTLKNDKRIFKGEISIWGWTVETEKQQNKRISDKESKPRFNYVVCVALDQTWRFPKYYVFSWKEAIINNNDVIKRAHANIKKRIHIFQNPADYKVAQDITKNLDNKSNEITELDEKISKDELHYLERWDRILGN
jgi:hypothetical protein